jgi:hypothetical protein
MLREKMLLQEVERTRDMMKPHEVMDYKHLPCNKWPSRYST